MSKEFEKYLIKDSMPLVEALRVLNKTGKRIVFLVDQGVLRGSLTYGDVSRWILKGSSLNSPAYQAATMNPVFISEMDVNDADKMFSRKGVNAIPVVNNIGKVIDILFRDRDVINFEQIDTPVVIMAGGKGTRLYPYTKILPKPLIPIGDIPISEHIVNRFYANGCREFYFIVNYMKNMIKAYFNEIEKPYDVYFVDEEKPLGTGGGLSLIKKRLSTTFILTNCDSFIDVDYAEILKFHKHKGNFITMICSRQIYEVPYGVIEMDDSGELLSMLEKPSFPYLMNTGTYIVEPEVIELIDSGRPTDFPDVIQKAKDSARRVGIYIVGRGDWLDMGQFDSMEEMKKRLNVSE